ncbi:MAG: winged helix DNA-binding domain-containing protein [Thermoplasmata archaeon]|nr:winged helix DNA-binding domain-containing protein [Thermoplasmata archaeon]
MKVSKITERRMVLGLQGLWPGRRWRGREGVRSALVETRRIQVDPLDVVGRNQDLVLASRVAGYRAGDLEALLYGERIAFEHGGAMSIWPRARLGLHWSWVQNEGLPVRWETWGRENAAVVRRVLADIDRNGPHESRDYPEGARTADYRAGRLEGLALYYLWRKLDVLVHHREGNRKFYDRTERMFGAMAEPLPRDVTRDEGALETLRWLGLTGKYGIAYLRTQEDGRGRSKLTKAQIRQRLVEAGRLVEVEVEGDRTPAVLPTEWQPILEEVESGGTPKFWKPLTAETEAVFVAPLDVVAGRERARTLFDFEYLWEVYKPAADRRWGYYVLPVLVGDRLVGRIEPTFDRTAGALCLERAWWERGVDLATVVVPLARGIRRTLATLGGAMVRLGRVGPAGFKDRLEVALRSESTVPAD